MNAFNKDQVFDYVSTADSWININDALGPIRIRNLIAPLIESINDEGGVSYVLNVDDRYRSSTLATVLDALVDVKLLPLDAVHHMQDHLFSLKDSFTPKTDNDDKIDKLPEDAPAWGIDETPSVWTTSMAVIALLNTGFVTRDTTTRDMVTELRDTIYWLVEQAYPEGGWGYQKFSESPACLPSVPMTALAMKAIIIAQNERRLFNDDAKRSRRFNKIVTALEKGKDFLMKKEQTNQDGSSVYWSFQDVPGVSITTWVLETLKLLAESTIPCYSPDEYKALKPKVLRFIYEDLPNENIEESYCQSEKFFFADKSASLKYKPQLKAEKSFYTFKPFIVSKLLDLGESPHNPQICLMVKWLLENREQHWTIQEYNSSSPCSISAAMAINVIVKWLKHINEKSFSNIVFTFINSPDAITVGNNNNCIYHLPCNSDGANNTPPNNAPPESSGLFAFMSRHKFKIIGWFISVVIMYFVLDYVISLPSLVTLSQNLFSGEKYVEVIIVGAIGSLLGSFVLWAGHRLLEVIRRSNQEGGGTHG